MDRTELILNTLLVIVFVAALVVIIPLLGHQITTAPDCSPGFDEETAARLDAINAEIDTNYIYQVYPLAGALLAAIIGIVIMRRVHLSNP